MDMTGLANNPIVIGIIAGIIGILIGWFFTRRGWRSRAEEAESRAADLAATQKREEREMGESSEQVEQLQASLKAAQDELEKMRAKASELKTEVESAHSEQSEADSVQSEADSNAEARASESSDLQMQISLLQEVFDAATQNAASELEQARMEAETLAATKVALEAELSALREEVENEQGEMHALRAQAEESGQAAKNKEIALSEAYDHAVVVQRQLEQREEEFGVAQSELESLRTEIAALTKTKGELEQRVQRSRSDVAGDLAVLTSTMLKLKDEALEESNARIAELTKEVETLRGQS